MDSSQFDGLVKRLARPAESRRGFLRGLAASGLGLGAARLPLLVTAQERKPKGRGKDKPRKPKPNQYGCLEVGDPCGRSSHCCSGICKGKKGKKTCRAHDTGTCHQTGTGICLSAKPQNISCNNNDGCRCFTTTAGSNVCAELKPGDCADCGKDADCAALGFVPGTVCVPMFEGYCGGQCESGMACLTPCGPDFPEPTP
jgi:hypothetical protein